MLSPSSPGQRNISEEDSSGSDAGSEAGLEPETDRFGFIVTNGSTAGSVGPPPELVRQREAKWINLITQWERMLLKKTSKVKVQCQKGIPASLRARCWPLLCGASERMKQNDKLYTSLDSQPALQSWVDVIERDLDRQFPFHEMFLSKDGHGQRGLFRVLKAYTQYQPEDGYCQAQGPVAAVLLMNMPAEEAFWCLVQISEQYLPGYYSPLLEGVLFDAAMLTWVLKRTCPAVHKHLQHYGVEPLMFATDWLMCLFTRHLPFNTLLRVWDLFFCYGVRVLLQVAVVLVRRVLGRAEQRKQCQGQMETLEKLRGVREQVQEEDDVFIAEVCSVQLSVKDLEKRTEKELEKWRKDRPSSTFDPRGRCHGYRMAWVRARQNAEEQNMKEREKGNLTVPLARSASTLSLSPSLLHKRFKKGGKVNQGEWEGGGKVVRHLSMGAKEDWRSWTELNLKKVQGVQEEDDTISEELKQQSEPKPTEQAEQKELQMTDKSQNTPTEQVRGEVKEQIEQVETRVPEKEENQVRETEEKTKETKVETEPTQGPVPDQTVENIVLTSQHKQAEELDSSSLTQDQDHVASEDQETEVKDTNEERETQIEEHEHTAAVEENQSEMQNANMDSNTEVETQESANPSEELIIQAGMKQEESTETENLQQTQADTVTDVSEVTNETKPDSEDDSEGETSTVKDTAETETQQQEVITETQQQDVITETETQQQEVITETDTQQQDGITETETQQQDGITETETQQQDVITETKTQQQDVITETETQQQDVITETETHEVAAEEKYPSTESLAEESHTQTETETDELAQTQEQVDVNAALQDKSEAELEQTDSEQNIDSIEAETLTERSLECIQPEEGTNVRADTETERETPDNNVTETSEAFAQSSENESDATAPELRQEEEIILPVQSHGLGLQVDQDKTEAEEPLTETQTNEETTDSVAPPYEEITSPQPEVVNLTVEPDEKTSSEEPTTSEEPAPEQPNIQVSIGAVEEAENKDGEDNVFIYAEPLNSPKTDSHPKIQEKDSDCAKVQTESKNSSVTQTSEHRSSRSSGDFCVRRSSTSRGSRLGRKLSEDLFTMPEKVIQPKSVPDHPEVQPTESRSNPEAVNPNQTPPDVTQSSEVTTQSADVTADPPKRFGLFRRLRGEQPKKAQTKGPAKMQVPKILIQDFSDSTGTAKPVVVEEQGEEKLSSRERRRRRRERERREKEEERLRKKREKELEKERRKPQTRGKSFQVQREKGVSDEPPPAKAGSQTHRHSVSYAESYF